MTGSPARATDFQVRRVVHASGPDGRSLVASDAPATTRVETPAFTVVDLWRFGSLPASLATDDGLAGGMELVPPSGAAVVRMSAIAPDAEWAGQDYGEALAAMAHDEGGEAGEDSAVHATDTVDVVVVMSGEVYCVTDEGETLLRAGDAVVQLGNRHSWSNRSDQVCTVVFVMAAASR